MYKRPQYIAVGMVVVLTLLVLNLPSRATARLKLAFGSLFLPLFGLTSAAQQAAVKSGDFLISRRELVRQLDLLRNENAQLRLQATQALEVVRENNQFRQLYGWQQRSASKYRLANVVLRDPANWWRTVEIDLGSRDGIRENMPVLTSDGLVGRIGQVSYTRSQVVLIGDPNCKVSALVENEARDMGVITVSGVFDGSLVSMEYLPPKATLKTGQNVVTSGLGGVFPRGIPVGKVVDAQPAEFGLTTEADIKLSADLGSLEEVWVLISEQKP